MERMLEDAEAAPNQQQVVLTLSPQTQQGMRESSASRVRELEARLLAAEEALRARDEDIVRLKSCPKAASVRAVESEAGAVAFDDGSKCGHGEEEDAFFDAFQEVFRA